MSTVKDPEGRWYGRARGVGLHPDLKMKTNIEANPNPDPKVEPWLSRKEESMTCIYKTWLYQQISTPTLIDKKNKI